MKEIPEYIKNMKIKANTIGDVQFFIMEHMTPRILFQGLINELQLWKEKLQKEIKEYDKEY
jgi:hypothetical protein